MTLPFLTDETGYSGKNLSWIDINDSAKDLYYQYILENQSRIKEGKITSEEFAENLPTVTVEVHLTPEKEEKYFAKELSFSIDNGGMEYGIYYKYGPSKIDEIYKMIQNLLSKETLDKNNLSSVKMNLLPTEYYSYSISVPGKGTISYDILKMYKYMALEAERDDFSRRREQIGSKSLVKLLQRGLTGDDKLKVEKEYNHFFEEMKKNQ